MSEKLPEALQLEIVTPTRQLFCGPVDEVSVPGKEGYLGILPGHAPLLSELKPGVISYRVDMDRVRLFCGWGFVEVLPNRVSVLAEIAETAEEIDVGQAGLDKAEAESQLRSRGVEVDYQKALDRWSAAVARIEVAQP